MNRKIENITVYFATMFGGGGVGVILLPIISTSVSLNINKMIIHSFRNLPSSSTN